MKKLTLYSFLFIFLSFHSISLAQEIDEKYRIDKKGTKKPEQSKNEAIALIHYTPVPIIFNNIRGGILFQTSPGRYHELIAGTRFSLLNSRNTNYIEYRYKFSRINPDKKFNQMYISFGGTVNQYFVNNAFVFPPPSSLTTQYIAVGGIIDVGLLFHLRNSMYSDITLGMGIQYYSQADGFSPRFSGQDILFFINQEDSGFEPLYRLQLRHYISINKKKS